MTEVGRDFGRLSIPIPSQSTELDPAFQTHLTSGEKRTRITSLELLATVFLTQPRTSLVFFAARVNYWLMLNLPTKTSWDRTRTRTFSAKRVSSPLAPNLCWCWGYSSHMAGLGTFPSLNFIGSLCTCCFFSFFRSSGLQHTHLV